MEYALPVLLFLVFLALIRAREGKGGAGAVLDPRVLVPLAIVLGIALAVALLD